MRISESISKKPDATSRSRPSKESSSKPQTESQHVPARIGNERGKLNEKTPLKSSPVVLPTKPSTTNRERLQMHAGRDAKVLFMKNDPAKPEQQEQSQDPKQKAKFYKTSIEKWRPVGDAKIHCPRCQSHKRPIVLTHTERVTESSFVSMLIMTCWPLCFAPCLFPEPTHENLHCPVCRFHLGIYDHQQKIVLCNPKLSRER